MKQGLIQIYTGNGKGKTSAALGVVLRAAGAGYKCVILQFMKSGFDYSETAALRKLNDYVTIEQYGSDSHVIEKRQPSVEEKNLVNAGIARVKELFQSGGWDVIVLDEICVAVHFGMIPKEDVGQLLAEKPGSVELILTGRYCPDEWFEQADLVTEMKEVKHYYRSGILSRRGIDC